MHLVRYVAAFFALFAFSASVAHAEDFEAHETKSELEVPAPVWKVGQWWRIHRTSTLDRVPRPFLRRVTQVRQDGYVIETVDETTGTTRVSLVSKGLNFISNSVEGYPKPQMLSEALPDNGVFKFPIKVGSRWEHSYLLVSKGTTKLPVSITGTVERTLDLDTRLPTIMRGAVDRAVEITTLLGRGRAYQINLWWKSEGAVPYQETCMYLPEIGWCAEHSSGPDTSRVIEIGFAK